MSFSPNTFLSNINAHNGLAKPSRFEVILPIPPYINQFVGNSVIDKILDSGTITDITTAVNLSFGQASFGRNTHGDSQSNSASGAMSRYLALQCESAELPGKTFQTADVKIYGPIFKVPYQTQYADMTLTFLCTNEFMERKLFDRWMDAIMPADTNNLRYPRGTKSRYMTNITIVQYDDHVKQIFAVELIDAFPIGLAPQSLSWGEDSFHRLAISFAYQKYEPIYGATYNLSALEIMSRQGVKAVPGQSPQEIVTNIKTGPSLSE